MFILAGAAVAAVLGFLYGTQSGRAFGYQYLRLPFLRPRTLPLNLATDPVRVDSIHGVRSTKPN
jgi:hypothetical protein